MEVTAYTADKSTNEVEGYLSGDLTRSDRKVQEWRILKETHAQY